MRIPDCPDQDRKHDRQHDDGRFHNQHSSQTGDRHDSGFKLRKLPARESVPTRKSGAFAPAGLSRQRSVQLRVKARRTRSGCERPGRARSAARPAPATRAREPPPRITSGSQVAMTKSVTFKIRRTGVGGSSPSRFARAWPIPPLASIPALSSGLESVAMVTDHAIFCRRDDRSPRTGLI